MVRIFIYLHSNRSNKVGKTDWNQNKFKRVKCTYRTVTKKVYSECIITNYIKSKIKLQMHDEIL